MFSRVNFPGVLALTALFVLLCGCGEVIAGTLSYAPQAPTVLASYSLSGETGAVRDPSVLRQGNTYYAFVSQPPGATGGQLPIHCSTDKVTWTVCGMVFRRMPVWAAAAVPGSTLWAPDISYFNGLYHLYYAASTLGSQRSVMGLATNRTLNPSDPEYKWVDCGEVMQSKPGDDFNAIDPNVMVDDDGSVWLSYGSYWSGIKQRAIDPATGMLSTNDTARYDLATRPGVPNNPIEGASLVRHGGYYYLFVSVDYCCNGDISTDNYKQAVGRSTSPHGPFVDEQGTPMMNGGGTVLIETGEAAGAWQAPGGGTVWIDPDSGESLIVFHAMNMKESGAAHLWLKSIAWQNDWPVVE